MSFLDHKCEFCEEINDFAKSRIGRIYSKNLESRVVTETENFFVVPTMGQIVPNSLLILPKDHLETLASVESGLHKELIELIESIEGSIKEKVILFEHGAKKQTGASCGVYHAHLHVIPINSPISPNILLGNDATKCSNLAESLAALNASDNYVLFRNIDKSFYYKIKSEDDSSELFTSQYLRKWLVRNHFPLKEWDWKKYDFIEEDLLSSLTHLHAY